MSAVLCTACRRWVSRRERTCGLCGTPRAGDGAGPAYSIRLPDGTRAPIRGQLSLGRGPGNRVRLDDPAVSRRHVRLCDTGRGVEVHDLGSRSGTYVDGHRVDRPAPVREGQRIRLGDTYVSVARDRRDEEAGRTLVVPVGATVRVTATRASRVETAAAPPRRPRLRSGWALKRLDAGEGPRRYVLADLRHDRFIRFTALEADLVRRMDGTRTVPELVDDVAGRHGIAGVQRLAELLAELGEGGQLAGVEPGGAGGRSESRLRRLLRPRERLVPRAPDGIDRLYALGGYRLFTRPALVVVAALIAAGPVAFAVVLVGGAVRPLQVAGTVGLGAPAFLAGRLLVVALHELAHALTLAVFGRRPRRVGIKLVGLFPYAFVDTSDAWFEPRRRRIAVSAAGPAADALLAAVFSGLALVATGAVEDVAFQLALGAYAGALLNLNPMLERDGYHVLVDALDQPDLRRRARAHLVRLLARRRHAAAEPAAVAIYGVAWLGWSVVAAAVAGVVTLQVAARVVGPAAAAWSLAGVALAMMLVPAWLIVARAVRERRPEPAR
jgi:putative peptide zinc metalloprotease protein